MNAEAYKILRISPGESTPIYLLDFLTNDEQEFFTGLIHQTLISRKIQTGIIDIVRNDGSTVKAKVFVGVSTQELDHEELLNLVIADIGDVHRNYDQQLLESELRYRELAENINEGIFMTHGNLLTMVNTPLLKIFGYELEEIIGKSVWEFVVKEQRKKVREIFLSKMKNPDQSPVEVECLKKDGTRFWAEIRISPGKDQQKIFGVFSDITQRKNAELALRESEEKYRSVVNSMNDGFVLFENGGKPIAWNQATLRILKINQEELGNFLDIISSRKPINEDGKPYSMEQFPLVVTRKTHKPVSGELVGLEQKSGEYQWILFSSVPVSPVNGKKTRTIVLSFTDITRQKDNEQKLREINAIKDKLFSIIAHDLKSPYNAQMAIHEMLMDNSIDYTPEQRQQFIRMLHESARQTFALLDNLLLWSRTQTGKMPYLPVPVNIRNIIQETVKFHEISASVKNIHLETVISEDLPEVKADEDMLSTILRNLISNAIKFTPRNGTVTIKAEPGGKDSVIVSVKDNGIGIPNHIRKKLFVPSEIASTPGTENEKGTGLGLLLCKELIERHGGELHIRSRPGKGTLVSFTLHSDTTYPKCARACTQSFGELQEALFQQHKLRKKFLADIYPIFQKVLKHSDQRHFDLLERAMQSFLNEQNIPAFERFASNFGLKCFRNDRNQYNICLNEFEQLLDRLQLAEKYHQLGVKR